MDIKWILVVSVLSVNLISALVDAQRFGQCNTPDGDTGECIFLQSCQHLLELITKKPLLPNDVTYLRQSQCGARDGTVLVCCGPAPRVTPIPRGPSTPRVPSGPTSPGNVIPEPGVCGAGPADRIYGGNETEIDEFPWMALLEYTKPQNKKGFHCGGVLINNRYVLTASHCVNGAAIPSDWSLTGVRLGEWDLSNDVDCVADDCSDPVLNVPVELKIPHESYQPRSKNQLHDIALLRLSRPVTYTNWIKPICLPKATHLRNSDFVGQSLDVSGWGKTETASQSNIKLKARVDGVALEDCSATYRRQGITLANSQICAGGVRGIDSCRGDSGGPLIGLDTTNRKRPYFYLVGVVSFGPSPCGLEGWPGVYTKIGDYVDWIERNVQA